MNDWARLLHYSRRYWAVILFSVVLMACFGALHAAMPLLIGPVFDKVLRPDVANGPTKLFDLPWGGPLYLERIMPSGIHNVWTMVAIAILFVFISKGLLDYIGNYLISYAGFSSVTDLRNEVFSKVLRQGADFFESNSTGRVMSSIMSDIDKIQEASSSMLADSLRQAFSALGLLFVVLHHDWKLALVSITILPFVLIPTVKLGRRIRGTSRRTQDAAAEVNQILAETLTGHQVVKAFGTEKYESERFRKAGQKLLRGRLRYVLQQAVASPLIEVFAALTVVALLTYARTQIKTGAMTAGQFSSFIVALLMLYEPVKRLTNIHNIFQQALGAAQKVFEYLDTPESIQDKSGAKTLREFSQGVVFDSVFFRYQTSARGDQLHGINLEVKAGEVVALVGPSGAGKSTLASLVPRFYDVGAGAVRIDGCDVRDLTLRSLRDKIGLVAQDTFLFNDTVSANIAYGQKNIDAASIQAAAKAALADEFIEQLPGGYQTIIGERGVKLSGGQRQRLAIARAILKDAPILILDEATSHLDAESEMLVQRALSNLMTGRTVIVIAHRISTIRRAHKIVVIDAGRIAETGTHEDLVSGGGIYQRLHELQFLEVAAAVEA